MACKTLSKEDNPAVRVLTVPADMVILRGRVITVDPKDSIVSAVAVRDGKILFAGSDEEVTKHIDSNTKVIDLNGKTMLPGFIDSHQHFGQMAIAYYSVDLGPWTSVKCIADLKAKLKEHREVQPENTCWVCGASYDESKMIDKRQPNRRDLDEAVPDRPVIITHISGHLAVLNSKALEMLGITDDIKDLATGRYGRDDNGSLNGIVYGDAFWRLTEYFPAQVPPLPTEEICIGMKEVGKQYLAAGITSLCDIVTYPWTIRAYETLWKRKELPVRVTMYMRNTFFDFFENSGLYTGFGDSDLKIGGIKMFIDGGMSSGTAAVSDSPGYAHPVFCFTQEELNDLFKRIRKAGFQISAHANGDIAVNRYLNALEGALKEYPAADHRCRIEHCSVVNPEIIDRIKELGALPSLFATMPWFHGEKILRFINPNKTKNLFPFRAMLDAGIPVSAHSDYPTNPYQPLWGICSQVTRVTRDHNLPIGPEQKISVMEAIRTWTINAAYATFDEHLKGSIEPGKLADFVVLDRDPLKVNPAEIKDLNVVMTIVGGEIRHKI